MWDGYFQINGRIITETTVIYDMDRLLFSSVSLYNIDFDMILTPTTIGYNILSTNNMTTIAQVEPGDKFK